MARKVAPVVAKINEAIEAGAFAGPRPITERPVMGQDYVQLARDYVSLEGRRYPKGSKLSFEKGTAPKTAKILPPEPEPELELKSVEDVKKPEVVSGKK